MKPKEIRERSTSDLQEKLAELRSHLREFKFDLASGKVTNVREIRAVKKDIARILTELRLREGVGSEV